MVLELVFDLRIELGVLVNTVSCRSGCILSVIVYCHAGPGSSTALIQVEVDVWDNECF